MCSGSECHCLFKAQLPPRSWPRLKDRVHRHTLLNKGGLYEIRQDSVYRQVPRSQTTSEYYRCHTCRPLRSLYTHQMPYHLYHTYENPYVGVMQTAHAHRRTYTQVKHEITYYTYHMHTHHTIHIHHITYHIHIYIPCHKHTTYIIYSNIYMPLTHCIYDTKCSTYACKCISHTLHVHTHITHTSESQNLDQAN